MLVAIYVTVAIPIDVCVQKAYDRDGLLVQGNPKYTLWYDVAAVAVLSVAVMTFGVRAVLRHRRWATRRTSMKPIDSSVAPRLIVSPPIMWSLLGFAILVSPLAIVDGLPFAFVRVARISYGWVYLFLIMATIVFLIWSGVSRNILHILNDIIIHFARPHTAKICVSPNTVLRYHARHRIANRFRKILKKVLEGSPKEIIIVAHSQGTIIVLEELLKRRSEALLKEVPSLKLVTLGSPLTHLYQHHFPFLYPSISDGRWKRLRTYVPNWYNAYRVDDYVGNSIAAPDGKWPRNIPLPAAGGLKGHTTYWCREVFDQVLGEVFPGRP
jgi:hypothetical protein